MMLPRSKSRTNIFDAITPADQEREAEFIRRLDEACETCPFREALIASAGSPSPSVNTSPSPRVDKLFRKPEAYPDSICRHYSRYKCHRKRDYERCRFRPNPGCLSKQRWSE